MRDINNEKELLEKIEEWQTKSRADRDPFNKYVSMFIAYNIFYNLYDKKKLDKDKPGFSNVDFSRGDGRRATATIHLTKADELFKYLAPSLQGYLERIPFFKEEYWPREDALHAVPIARTLKLRFRSGDAKNTVDLLIKWLYKVRCNLVHGEKSYKDGGQRELLEMSTELLDQILQHLASRYIEEYGHPIC